MDKAAFEIPQRADRPTLRVMRQVLDEIEQDSREREQDAKRLSAPLERPRTPEEQARADELVKMTRGLFKIPEGGAGRRQPKLPPSADAPYRSHVQEGFPDSKHGERVKQDLAMRRTRRETADTG